MAYGSFTSHQYIEFIFGDEARETEFLIDLICTARSTPGKYFGPPESCYPAEDAEFELDSIRVADDESKTTVVITEAALQNILGKTVANDLIEMAYQEAREYGAETGEF